LCPAGHPDRSSSLNNLANALQTRCDLSGNRADLDQAIVHHQDALALYPASHPGHFRSLNNLADALQTRFEQSGNRADLDQAMFHHQDALALYPASHPHHSSSLNNLATALQTRFDLLGNRADLDKAIMHHQDALALRPAGHPDHSISLNNLATVFQTRFKQSGNQADLDQAILHHQNALALCPASHPSRSSSLNNLGSALHTRFEQSGNRADLDQAMLHHQDALALCPAGHPNHSGSLNNLAYVLQTCFEQSGNTAYLDQAILHHQNALALHPAGHPNHSMSLSNLADALQTRFKKLGNRADLDNAIDYVTCSLQALPSGHPMTTLTKWNLSTFLLIQYDCLHQNSHLKVQAFALLEQAVKHSTSSILERFECAVHWAHQAQKYHDSSALVAYSQALILLHTCLFRRSSVQSQHQFLVSLSSKAKFLASNAAACAIAGGQLEHAIELLEQGRSILFSNIQGYRKSIVDLHNADLLLANEFVFVGNELEKLASTQDDHKQATMTISTNDKYDHAATEKVIQRHSQLSKQWDLLIEQIRKIEGFADFLKAVPFSTLQASAYEGPVIIVNISEYQSDAIILYAHYSPTLVSLLKATTAELQHIASEMSDIQHNVPSSTKITKVLQMLWEIVVQPVIEQLSLLGVPEKSHIWWCPTSLLCGLPLHAAGPYTRGKRNLPDLYTSSYTSTLSALINGRSGMQIRSTAPDLLIIGQPDETIPRVKDEVEQVHKYFKSFKILLGEEANHNTILMHLAQYSWAHFACHGHVKENEPFGCSFQLNNDSQLTLLELMQARLPNAELAFLSACHSAAGDLSNTPDEVIHLASGMQFCGFRSVIGTLWAMVDLDGPDVANEFYKYMFQSDTGNIRNTAAALNHATREMRKRKIPIDRWINFVHIGI
jgi:CHAT domain-containing protein